MIRKVLPSIRSASCKPGPRTGLRELLPIVNCGAGVNAAVLNHAAALRFGEVVRIADAVRPLHAHSRDWH